MKKQLSHLSKLFLILLLTCVSMFSCTTEDYETGDGEYSYVRADFVETKTNYDGAFVSAVTDHGVQLMFNSPLVVSWKATADSTYRALLYYSREDNVVKPVSVVTVSVPNVRMTSALKRSVKTDPVTWESAWQSKKNEYVNLGIVLKTGKPDDKDNRHVVGMVCDTVIAHANGRRHARLRFYHDQNNIPAYYSTFIYMSIPMSKLPQKIEHGDTVTVGVNSFQGMTEKSFVY